MDTGTQGEMSCGDRSGGGSDASTSQARPRPGGDPQRLGGCHRAPSQASARTRAKHALMLDSGRVSACCTPSFVPGTPGMNAMRKTFTLDTVWAEEFVAHLEACHVWSLTAAVPEGRRLPGRGLHTAAKHPPIPVSKRHSQNEGQGHRFTCL